MHSTRYLETVCQDIRYSLRTLGRSRVFTATAILTLALGIGGNTAIFTVIRAVLLKPLEYNDPDRLVYLVLDNPKLNGREIPFSLLRYEETRKAAQSFSGVGSYLRTPENVTLSGGGDPVALVGARVSANFLDILGVQPSVGRSFLPGEDTAGGAPVAMISSGLWRERFSGDPQVAGKTTTINSIPYTIIGVLPEGFAFPFSKIDVWVTKPSEWSFVPSRFWQSVTTQIAFARLKPEATLAQARAEMEVVNSQYISSNPERPDAKPGLTVRVAPLKERVVSNVQSMLWILFGAAGLVLLIACANLASLLLARASFRSREFAVRAALGAGRGRLMRQLLSESLVLSGIGGAIGTLLTRWSLAAISHTGTLPLPRAEEIQVDAMVLGFTIALSVATGLLFGLFPSFEAARPNLAHILRQGGAAAGRVSSGRLSLPGVSSRSLLVVGQVALSIILLIGAGLLIQSFARLRNVDPGVRTSNLLTMKIPLPPQRYDTSRKRAAFFEELERRIAETPGVRNAAIVKSIPTTPWLFTNVSVDGETQARPGEESNAQLQSVTSDYFSAMGIPLRRGRGFTPRDNAPGAPPVIVINESFARHFWPSYPAGPNPVGQLMSEGADKIRSAPIIGIVADVHEGGLGKKPGPEFYVPLALHAPQIAYLTVRTSNDPLKMADTMRRKVMAIDPDQPVSDIRTIDEVFEAALGQRRLTMLMLGIFAAVALLLALLGLYGAIAYSVTQRTQEVGIRRALGADQIAILRLVLAQALGCTLAGVVIGVAGALAFTRAMKSLLFEVGATDPATFTGVILVFVIVAVVASLIPAWRALRIDPMTALRAG
jgi:putative ABC transport system permease protein